MWKKWMKDVLGAHGYSLVPRESLNPVLADLSDGELDIFSAVRQYTMTPVERVAALVHAVRYVASAEIEGSIVECGVWRGGSMMSVAKTLLLMGQTGRELYLFDTFEGMPEPSSDDVDFLNRSGQVLLQEARKLKASEQLESQLYAYSPLDTVKNNMSQTGYPQRKIHFVKGRVEDTIPANAPDKISVLRLDTDWYESTRHELIHLYPRISSGGVIILDDYGHWLGMRRAVDEYFEQNDIQLLLNRIDYACRTAIKR